MKQIIPSKVKGFTLVELLVSAIISSVILSISLSLINLQRAQFLSDQTRAQGNQNLRAAIDLMGADIKLAGERLDRDSSLPVIQLVNGNGTNNDFNEDDRLILQRKIISDTLTVCEPVNTSDKTIVVATKVNLPATSCNFSDIDNGNSLDSLNIKDALTDNLNQFRVERCREGSSTDCDRTGALATATAVGCDDECTVAIIVDPTSGDNELFYYTHEECTDAGGNECTDHINGSDTAEVQNIIHAIPLEGANFSRTYNAGAQIFIFEEREYSFDDDNGILNLTINREDRWHETAATTNSGNPRQLVNQLLDFDVKVRLATDHDLDDTTPPRNIIQNETPSPLPDWTTIRSLQVNLEASDPSESDLIDLPRGGCPNDPSAQRLCLTTEFFPRNALSR